MTAEVLAAVAGVAREVAAVGMGWVLAAARGVEVAVVAVVAVVAGVAGAAGAAGVLGMA